eukprot:9891045-Alexandrium_andersonii.AAC.1
MARNTLGEKNNTQDNSLALVVRICNPQDGNDRTCALGGPTIPTRLKSKMAQAQNLKPQTNLLAWLGSQLSLPRGRARWWRW